LALVPDSGSTWLLTHHLGLSRAIELTTTNRRMPAEEAGALGLAHRVVPPHRVLEEAVGWATELADGPKSAYRENRQILWLAGARVLDVALDEERATQGRLGTSPAHLEGMKAFLEKRQPDFRSVP
ncbi:MAG: enoyl-CoA hydratase/isomerase family protein, partial [Acidimicrobiia bacterium]